MSYDDIMCDIEEMVGDLYQEGYENGWNRCASQATHDYQDEWCDGFLTAWNAIAHEGRGWCHPVEVYGYSLRFECSACGYVAIVHNCNIRRDELPNYCPNCGAEVRYE